MDPVTAAILIGMAVSAVVGTVQANKQIKAQNAARKEQEKLRVNSVRAQVEQQRSKTQLALDSAQSRPTAGMLPSFATAALTGNQNANTNTTTPSSSGTF